MGLRDADLKAKFNASLCPEKFRAKPRSHFWSGPCPVTWSHRQFTGPHITKYNTSSTSYVIVMCEVHYAGSWRFLLSVAILKYLDSEQISLQGHFDTRKYSSDNIHSVMIPENRMRYLQSEHVCPSSMSKLLLRQQVPRSAQHFIPLE